MNNHYTLNPIVYSGDIIALFHIGSAMQIIWKETPFLGGM